MARVEEVLRLSDDDIGKRRITEKLDKYFSGQILEFQIVRERVVRKNIAILRSKMMYMKLMKSFLKEIKRQVEIYAQHFHKILQLTKFRYTLKIQES